MVERVKSFNNFLRFGGIFRCDLFNQLIREHPDKLLESIQSIEYSSYSLKNHSLCNCFANAELECDCHRMPLLNHLVYVISSLQRGRDFQLARDIIEALIERGCDPNEIDGDIGTVLHSAICAIDNDLKVNAPKEEYQLSYKCFEYLLETNKCDLNIDMGISKYSQAQGTPLSLAIDRKLTCVVEKLIAAGANASMVQIDESQLPPLMTEQDIYFYDMLYLAGLDKFPESLPLLYGVGNNLQIEHRYSKNNPPIMLYKDWIKRHKTFPKSLKNLSRIVLRNYLSTGINNDKVVKALEIPPTLLTFLKFNVK